MLMLTSNEIRLPLAGAVGDATSSINEIHE